MKEKKKDEKLKKNHERKKIVCVIYCLMDRMVEIVFDLLSFFSKMRPLKTDLDENILF